MAAGVAHFNAFAVDKIGLNFHSGLRAVGRADNTNSLRAVAQQFNRQEEMHIFQPLRRFAH